MLTVTDIKYVYDGTFNGFCCCVFESFLRRELPCAIAAASEAEPYLGQERVIETENARAERVQRSVRAKLSPGILEFLKLSLLTCLPDREIKMLMLTHLAYGAYGAAVLEHETDSCVGALLKAVRHLTREAHLFKGFVRFSETPGGLVAVIHPKNLVLPLLSEHFCARYPRETFLLVDATHALALLHTPEHTEILPAEDFTALEPDETERRFSALWRSYYQTAAIEQRENPSCRASHLPKRFWCDMTELNGG